MEQLVLLPGLLCDARVWRDQVEALDDVAQCTVPDYGSLDSIAAMAEHVLATAPPEFSLAGHSMGGRVAFQVIRRAPERVKRLALLNTGADCRQPGAAGEQEERNRMVLVDLARTQGMRAMGMKWLPPMMPPQRMEDAALVEEILQMVERKTPEIFFAQQRALLGRPDANPVLSTIQCPAMLLSGREDTWSPPSRHEEMAAKIPGSRVVIVAESGHMAPMEQPAAVSQALREWLSS
ncbi:MAG TPA: alpha/beta hydrolase [Bryobacteraceae bacterium]|jgi:pimeloyl-ACP methyl ester carboxylesterase